jgi:hypothetical protein
MMATGEIMEMQPLVTQLHFTRSEFLRCMQGVSSEEALQRFEPMNCLSWIVGHLASQEHFLWVQLAQGRNIAPDLRERVGYQKPASTPPWDEMWDLWYQITTEADSFLNYMMDEMLSSKLTWPREPDHEDVGTSLLRNIYHYWFHMGEAHAIRQMLGHKELPSFVGNMEGVRY